MKKILILLAALLSLTRCANSQADAVDQATPINEVRSGEFVVYNNGLIYDSLTMSKLGRVVDSLNLRFKKCEPKSYRSLAQGFGTYISVTKNVRAAREAIEQGISLKDFLKKFRTEEVKRNVWVVKSRDSYNNNKWISYDAEGDADGYSSVRVQDTLQNDVTEGWVYQAYGVRKREHQIDIFYLEKLESRPIPVEYARLIQYVDCMIDTTTTIFTNDRDEDYEETYDLEPGSSIRKFIDMAQAFDDEPKEPEIDVNDSRWDQVYNEYWIKHRTWDSLRILALDKKMQDENNVKLLNEAVDEAVRNRNGFHLDYYAQRYLSPAKALALKRSFRVRGFCSMDSRPRDHAVDICRLAAQNYQWDIFLRAHLDILSDNFERTSDGSWAWAGRGTYIKELEELDIDAIGLLIGTNLRTENVSENHYLAGASRVGRALAESKDKKQVEDLLFAMIQDSHLDPYNRVIMAYTLISYNRHLKDEKLYRSNLERIGKAIDTLPDGLRGQFSVLLKE